MARRASWRARLPVVDERLHIERLYLKLFTDLTGQRQSTRVARIDYFHDNRRQTSSWRWQPRNNQTRACRQAGVTATG
jgi:hypothetical protein